MLVQSSMFYVDYDKGCTNLNFHCSNKSLDILKSHLKLSSLNFKNVYLYCILYIRGSYNEAPIWADNMFCVPEQLVDSDVVARERSRITW